MRKFKNQFAAIVAAAMTGVMALGLVATATPVVSAYAADETKKSEYTIEVQYDSFEAIISSETKTDPYVILEVLKDDSGSKVSGTYTYETNGESEIRVDLSFLKASKPSYLRVHGSSETATSDVKTVNAQPAKISVKYTSGQMDATKSDAENLAAAFANGKTKITAADITNNVYQYRPLYATWFEYLSGFDQAVAEVAGTTILVRKAAVDGSTDPKDDAPASAEVKVKIAAAPKAPKVTVDYAKGSVKLPKKTEAQLVYAGEGTTVPASMKLADGKDTLYASGDGTSFAEVTNENLGTYFEVAADGAVTAKSGCTFASNAAGSSAVTGTDALTYVVGSPESTSSGSNITAWKDVTATTASPEDILGWFDETKADETKKALLKSGFTLVVRTKADKKAASNANILVIEGAAEATKTEGKDEVKVGSSTLTWETVANGIKYTGTGFEYYDSAKSKWVAIKSGSVVKTSVSADATVKVRKAGVKATKETAGVLPSESIDITVKKYVDPNASTSAKVTEVKVTVKNGEAPVQSGDTIKQDVTGVKCTATVTGDEGVAQTVTWTVSIKGSTNSAASTVDKDGVITFGADDAGKTIVITATSTVDTTKTGTFEIAVAAADAT